ncbi:MAG: hypothetical protein ABI169_16155 [Chitinophagaceae bacterium]
MSISFPNDILKKMVTDAPATSAVVTISTAHPLLLTPAFPPDTNICLTYAAT